jgi:hypothetical protein
VAPGKPLLPGLVIALVLIGCGGGSTPAPWTSRATFHVHNKTVGSAPDLAGTYTAADSTVPAGKFGTAQLDPGTSSSRGTVDLGFTIGADPVDGPNVSQFGFDLTTYHGVGSYTMTGKEAYGGMGGLAVTVRSRSDDLTNTWTLEGSSRGVCVIGITADAAASDATIREIRGSITCDRLYDETQHTTSAELNGHFDVFAQIWCNGDQPVRPCRSPSRPANAPYVSEGLPPGQPPIQ